MEAATLKIVWPGYHQDLKIISPPTCVDGLLIVHIAAIPHKHIDADLEFAYKRSKVLADMLEIPVHESPEVTGTILGLVRRSVERLQGELKLFKEAGHIQIWREQKARIAELEAAIVKTLNENGHLADGENCTLIDLKRAMPEWELE